VQTEESGNLSHFQATIVPWLWFLTRVADCRIFQKITIPDIIKEVFRERGFTDFDDKLSGSYREWEYCVQYRETDFNFVSRLMEQEGIYYYFRHENGKHTLVLADSIGAHEPFPDYEEIRYQPSGGAISKGEYISDWDVEKEVQPSQYALNDFDFKNPKVDLRAVSKMECELTEANYEVYDYPGEYSVTQDGENYARTRIEELHTQYEVVSGNSDARGMCTGFTFKLTGYRLEAQCREYLITSATYQLDSGGYEAGRVGEGGPVYSCGFTAIDAQQPFRSSRNTSKPSISGPQTAEVVGPKGEEIHTDEYGRVKVQFHWDRQGMKDENSSCWIRVSQSWAGKNWGAMIIPRIGQEVIVEFLEGDPDRPIITGVVYNADNMPPYPLPANKTMSTLKSNSSKEGQGFNEIRFEDKKDEEQIFVFAQKNQDVRVQNDSFEWVGNDRHLIVEKDKFEHVKNNRHEIVETDHKEEIRGNRHLKVNGNESKKVDGKLSLIVGADVAEEFDANHSEVTTGDYYLKAKNIVIEAETNITLNVGNSYISIEKGPPGTIEMKSGGVVKIEAQTNAEVKGTAGLKLESPATTDLKGTKTTVSGDAMCEVKGGIVKIN
ncbi:MAG: type VI secretion system tip protein VgrG, partial [Sedimentisphaerales bacterium]|nr:type VI secretion system tip protein VgrG [Sedimentisphaerales bacterium]